MHKGVAPLKKSRRRHFMSLIKLLFNLQFFAEGASAEGGEGTVEGTVDDAQEPVIKYGKQVTDGTEDEEVEPKAKPSKPTFDELINGDYKDDFSERTSQIVQNRIKGIKEAEDKLTAITPALYMLAEKYGIEDVNDVKAISDAIANDNQLFEAEADERGVDVETLKHIHQIEGQNKFLTEQMAQKEKDMENAKAWQDILQQAEQVKEVYPDFDIEAEMQDENFGHMVAVGIPLKNAYEVVHLQELQARAGNVIAKKTAEKVANSVKANKKRTVEGTTTGQAVTVKSDPSSWTDEERDAIFDRVMSGEKIYL